MGLVLLLRLLGVQGERPSLPTAAPRSLELDIGGGDGALTQPGPRLSFGTLLPPCSGWSSQGGPESSLSVRQGVTSGEGLPDAPPSERASGKPCSRVLGPRRVRPSGYGSNTEGIEALGPGQGS